MSSLYDSLPITSCCRTVCEAMGTASTRPPPPTRPSWPCVTGPLKTSRKPLSSDSGFSLSAGLAGAGHQAGCPAGNGGIFSEKWEKTAVPMSATGRMLFAQDGLYTGILAFINA